MILVTGDFFQRQRDSGTNHTMSTVNKFSWMTAECCASDTLFMRSSSLMSVQQSIHRLSMRTWLSIGCGVSSPQRPLLMPNIEWFENIDVFELQVLSKAGFLWDAVTSSHSAFLHQDSDCFRVAVCVSLILSKRDDINYLSLPKVEFHCLFLYSNFSTSIIKTRNYKTNRIQRLSPHHSKDPMLEVDAHLMPNLN